MTDENQRGAADDTSDDRWTEVATRQHEPGTEGDLATDIVYTIAEAGGVDPTEVRDPKLHEVVDVAALKAMFFSRAARTVEAETGRVEFPYNEYRVRVQRDGWIRVFAPSLADR